MKEDYLWDKSGENAEIQGLENALKAFRFEESAPPVLPQKVFVVEKEEPRRWFRFGFAFAAFAAALMVVSIVWFQTGPGKTPVAEIATRDEAAETAEKTAEKTVERTADKSFNENRADEALRPDGTVTAPVKPKIVKIRQKKATVWRPVKAVLRKTIIKEPAETLTAEEKYAYNQLMLALSITGSQLKIVKDKVQGIEEKNAALESAK